MTNDMVPWERFWLDFIGAVLPPERAAMASATTNGATTMQPTTMMARPQTDDLTAADDGVLYEGSDDRTGLTWRLSLCDGQLVLAVETETVAGRLRQITHWLGEEATADVLTTAAVGALLMGVPA